MNYQTRNPFHLADHRGSLLPIVREAAPVWTAKDMAVSALIFIAIGGFVWIALALGN